MKKIYILLPGIILLMNACGPSYDYRNHEIKYPVTRKIDQSDEYFGTKVEDPYRWLEDDRSEETARWVESQNELTNSYLDKIPFRDKVTKRIEELWNYEKYGTPFIKAGKYYYYKNDGLQDQSVLYAQESLNGIPEIFLDPNSFSDDGTISLSTVSFTNDGSLCAYSISESGSDWRKIIAIDTETKKQLGDTIINVKFSDIAWKNKDGFYYSAYDKPGGGSQLSGITEQHKLLYHELGTPQSEDILILGGSKIPRRYIQAQVSEDQRFLVISAAINTTGNELYIQDLQEPENKTIQLIDDFENDYFFIDNIGAKLIIYTNDNAPNYKIVTLDISNPDGYHWEELVPEKEEALINVSSGGGKLFLHYLMDASSRIYQYSYDGTKEREIKLPAIGNAGGFSGEKNNAELFYYFTSFTHPSTIYKLEISTGESTIFQKPSVKFNPEKYETKQVFYKSKDGTSVPMFIVHRADIEMNSQNPTLLYGYGGFNISMTPGFNLRWLSWLDMGGVFAQPNLRGGGEYGEEWHLAGTKLNKQNVFDDFICAAEYLHSEGYTSPEKTTIYGRSNGGLLVGATMTLRPDICKVALPAVGVLDMLKYHKFTAGAGWIYDYGCADSSKTMFEYLYSYSPVHNVNQGMEYPATMITTADHDDRVVPAHSFKFAAVLQDKYPKGNPILIRIETKSGHGSGMSTSKIIDETADIFSFAWYNMDEVPEYVKSEK